MLGAIRTLIVDDSSTLRAMLDVVISDNRDFRPPEHAANASQAIEILEERLFDLTRPIASGKATSSWSLFARLSPRTMNRRYGWIVWTGQKAGSQKKPSLSQGGVDRF